MISRKLLPLAKGASFALAASVSGATSGHAATVASIDVSDVAVIPPTITERTLEAGPGIVDEIFFDIEVEHFGQSFAGETEIEVIAPDSTARLFTGADDFDWDFGTSSFTGGFSFGPVSAEGTWLLRFSDSIDDGSNPDHEYLTGSIIELRGSGDVGVIPLPAGLPLLLGALGLLGLVRTCKHGRVGSGIT